MTAHLHACSICGRAPVDSRTRRVRPRPQPAVWLVIRAETVDGVPWRRLTDGLVVGCFTVSQAVRSGEDVPRVACDAVRSRVARGWGAVGLLAEVGIARAWPEGVPPGALRRLDSQTGSTAR